MIKVCMSNEALTDMVTKDLLPPQRCVKGLPRDCKLVGVNYSQQTGTLEFFFVEKISNPGIRTQVIWLDSTPLISKPYTPQKP